MAVDGGDGQLHAPSVFSPGKVSLVPTGWEVGKTCLRLWQHCCDEKTVL